MRHSSLPVLLMLLLVSCYTDGLAEREDLEDIFAFVAPFDIVELTVDHAVSLYLPKRQLEPDHVIQMKKEFLEFTTLPEPEKEEILAGLPTKFRFVAVLLKAVRKHLKKEFAALPRREQAAYKGSVYEYVIYQLTNASYERILKEKKADYKKRGLTKKQIKQEVTLRQYAILAAWARQGPMGDVLRVLQAWRGRQADDALPPDVLEMERAAAAGQTYEQRLEELLAIFSDDEDDEAQEQEVKVKAPEVKTTKEAAAAAPVDIVKETAEAARVLGDLYDYVGKIELFARKIDDLCARYTPGRAYSLAARARLARQLMTVFADLSDGRPQELANLMNGEPSKYAELAELFGAFRRGATREFAALSEKDQKVVESVQLYMVHMVYDHSRLRLLKENKAEFERRKLTKAQIKEELKKRDKKIIVSWKAAERSEKSEL